MAGGVFTQTGRSATSEGGAPRASAYGAAFRARAAGMQARAGVVAPGHGTRASVGGFAAAAAHASAVSAGARGYRGVLPLSRQPQLSKPRPWLAGTAQAGR